MKLHTGLQSINEKGVSTYTYNTKSRMYRVARDIFSVLFLPYGLYRCIHALIGKIVVLAASPRLLKLCGINGALVQKNLHVQGDYRVRKISIRVDGYTVDAVLFGKESTFANGRWVLASNGNGEFYENNLTDEKFTSFLDTMDANALLFNYPGVGKSTGLPSREALVSAYRAMLAFLEDENGVGAKEIIGYGFSLGGGVQAEALRSHTLKKDIKYVFVKTHTFSNLQAVTSSLTNRFLGFLVRIFGWNIGSVESSQKLQAPEVIIQSAKKPKIAQKPEAIVDDGVITKKASLAYELIKEKDRLQGRKYFIGVSGTHSAPFHKPKHIANIVQSLLASQNSG